MRNAAEDKPKSNKIKRSYFVEEGETRQWQPVDYQNPLWEDTSDGPIFHIRMMTGQERRHWQSIIRSTVQETANDSKEVKLRTMSQRMPDQLIANFVTQIDNVPAKILGLGDAELITLRDTERIIKAVRKMPASDEEALDAAIWNVAFLLAGEVKNSKSSPEPPAPEKPEAVKTAPAGKAV